MHKFPYTNYAAIAASQRTTLGKHMRFEVLMAVTSKTVLWDITNCSLVDR
jgi:hypothetical protein